jgi:hypothetical protein
MSRRYNNDPYWLTARFNSDCAKCHKHIKKGDRIFYYPNGRKAYCEDPCGKEASADFEAAAQDEAFMNGGGW